MTARRGHWRISSPQVHLLAAAVGLTLLGVFFVHSTTAAVGEPFPSREAKGQIIKACVAVVGLYLVTRIDYRWLESRAYEIYLLVAGVLACMLAVKLVSGGINRFISLYIFQVQPSEVMKIGLVLALARYLRFREDQRTVLGLAGPFLIMLFPMALVLFQPNLGLSLMFPPVLVAMLLVAGAKPRHLAVAVTLGVALLPAAYFASDRFPLLKSYQRERLRSFFVQDAASARDQGFQLEQSLIAVGSGGAFGKGYRQGTQNVLEHLPERHTDFIFSIVCEELGFAGAVLTIGLQVLLWVSILRIALHTREPFGRLVAAGFAVAFAAQSFENIGMTLGLTPITGIALPFVSLAGSNLVASYLAVGIVLEIGSTAVPVVATRDLDPRDLKGPCLVLEDRPAALIHSRWPVE